MVGIVLCLLNPIYNPGTLIYKQRRMGRDCRPFDVYKFRSMLSAPEGLRNADDPLETDRITPLGMLLRKSRLDELPQIVNVLRGEMSLIGPRPDEVSHAKHFIKRIPGYRERHAVRPGISGLAQVTIGYVEGTEATRKKVEADLEYLKRESFRLELGILAMTLLTMLRFQGK